MICLKECAEGILLFLHIQPKASRTSIMGMHGDALKIAVQAPPVDNAANEALTDFLAETLSMARRDVLLKSGGSSRRKTFLLRGLSLSEAERLLAVKGKQ